ncbi:LLM class F420-dependent oxidoreductase, partial [Amycolatopsis sp. H20-H5]|nr:LLM class F420-dependent oxidoreductase [Amycolatopsis sp. H20-H5]
EAALRQIAAQLTVYLKPPGYGEMFSRLGHGDLVARARAGVSRAELTGAIPISLIAQVCAIGSAAQLTARIDDYHRAGADHVGLVPGTAEDPGGNAVLTALSALVKETPA